MSDSAKSEADEPLKKTREYIQELINDCDIPDDYYREGLLIEMMVEIDDAIKALSARRPSAELWCPQCGRPSIDGKECATCAVLLSEYIPPPTEPKEVPLAMLRQLNSDGYYTDGRLREIAARYGYSVKEN